MHLRRFAEYGNFDVVRKLLDSGCHVDGDSKVTEGSVDNGNVETPLYLAARLGNEDVVKLLLEYGADVHKARLQVHRPMEGAVKSGSIAIAQKLLAYGAVCDCTIVVQALLSEYPAMVELLLGQFTEKCQHTLFGRDLAEEMLERGLSSMLDLLYNRRCFRYSDGRIVAYSPVVED
uniref:Ankyrin repeat protein n=1 Tax=Bionectria ochroleuca TaxID=29856 RepID=A0A8H7N682_BIOOC